MKKFVFEIIDASAGCIAKDFIFEADMHSVLELIDPEASTFENWDIYGIDIETVKQIELRFNLNISNNNSDAILRCTNQFDERPYKTHTNRELLLMLNGHKPFAVFSDYYDEKTNSLLTLKNFLSRMLNPVNL